MRFYTGRTIDRGHRPFRKVDWEFNSSISSIQELSSAIISHIASDIASGSTHFTLPGEYSQRILSMTFRKSTAARMSTISDEIVKNTFETAFKKPSGWLQIFVLDAADFQKVTSRGLSSVQSELESLENISKDSIQSLSSLGMGGGTMNLLKSLVEAVEHSSSAPSTPTPSPPSSKVVSTETMTSAVPSTPQSLDDCFQHFESSMRAFFNAADLFSLYSANSRFEGVCASCNQ